MWPGWALDLPAADYWGDRTASALSGALSEAEATRLASAYLEAFPPKDGQGKRDAVAGAAAWLAKHGPDLEAALAPLMPGLLTDGQFIGAVSAQAVTGGAQVAKGKHAKPKGGKHRKTRTPPAPVQTGTWKPGDTAEASRILGGLGNPGAKAAGQVPQAAKGIAQGVRTALGRVLVEGAQAAASAADTAKALAAAVADKAKAAAAALEQVLWVASKAAVDWYRSLGVEYLDWVTEDGAACPICLANEDEGPLRLGDPFDSGDTEAPAHPHCRCITLPSLDAEAPQGTEAPAGPEPGEADGEAPEPEEASAPEPEPPAEPEEAAEPEPVQFARELAEAWQAGHTIGEQLEGGGQGGVARGALSDGTEVVVKQHQSPQEAVHEYLAGLVARALGIDDAGAALTGNSETIAKLVPGSPGGRLIGDAWFHDDRVDKAGGKAELARQMGLRNAREIGLLDWVTDNWDRNGGNWLADHDAVRPVDHAAAWSEMDPGQANTISSPFTKHWLGTDPGSFTSPFTRAQLGQFRAGLEALKPEFTAHGAATEYGFMMDRLATVEAVAS